MTEAARFQDVPGAGATGTRTRDLRRGSGRPDCREGTTVLECASWFSALRGCSAVGSSSVSRATARSEPSPSTSSPWPTFASRSRPRRRPSTSKRLLPTSLSPRPQTVCCRCRPDVVFHLAAVVSGGAEADFERGYRVNLDGTRQLLEAGACHRRWLPSARRVTSPFAVFGAPLPDVIGDDHCTTPLTSYGTQKTMTEGRLCDYTRRGFVDGVGVRLPTICVRPRRAQPGRLGILLRHHPRAPERRHRGATPCPRAFATGTPRRAQLSASSSTRR